MKKSAFSLNACERFSFFLSSLYLFFAIFSSSLTQTKCVATIMNWSVIHLKLLPLFWVFGNLIKSFSISSLAHLPNLNCRLTIQNSPISNPRPAAKANNIVWAIESFCLFWQSTHYKLTKHHRESAHHSAEIVFLSEFQKSISNSQER